MKVVYKRTVLERLEDAVTNAHKQNKEIAFVAINREEARQIYRQVEGSMPFDFQGFEKTLKDTGNYICGVPVCLFGSEAHAKYQATI